jgi:hypothetical protein
VKATRPLQRKKPMNRGTGLSQGCGLRFFADEIAARLALAGSGQQDSSTRHENSAGKEARKCQYCPGWHLFPVRTGLERKPAERAPGAASQPRKPARDTGFPPRAKLLIRTRAGNGDPGNACCEACGTWCGEHGGQIQHIYARGKGGTTDPLYSSAANGALICGTPSSGCHGLCENRDPHMNEAGFWRERNGKEKPGDYPVMLHSQHGSGMTVWLLPDGTYGYEAPGEVA